MNFQAALALGLPLGIGIAAIGSGIGLGLIGQGAMTAIGRQPEATAKIQLAMIIIAALAEALTIYALRHDVPALREDPVTTARAPAEMAGDRPETRAMNLIDIPQVLTQIAGFLLLVWALRQWAWSPLLAMLEARREKIAGEFRHADQLKAEAGELENRYRAGAARDRGAGAAAHQEAVAEGQKLTAEIARPGAGRGSAARWSARRTRSSASARRPRNCSSSRWWRCPCARPRRSCGRSSTTRPSAQLAGEFIDEVAALP